ncbi:hypothetical protein AB0953_26265 [Streptomyces sp. NPDC046866]|uniref:hypothetical protein n=1 Tax=Streptomyces sp. NPDC046866 TaxID=3154921 RepID=UPI003456E549
MSTATTPPGPARRPARILTIALGLIVAAVVFYVLKPTAEPSAKDGGAGRPAAASASASATAAAPSTSSPAPAAAAAAKPSDRPMIALSDAFPAQVPDGAGGSFTKVGAAVLKSCVEPDSVGPVLAGHIARSKGCVGEQVALYKDDRGNQFNLAVFTMKDPLDTVHLVTRLGAAFDDYEVGAQAPPPGSGLRTLPPDSGMVQSFTGQGRAMVVGLGQWSDGGTRDYQRLVERLDPLLKAVSARVARYETTP